jgi:hypothetical protein
MKAHIKGIALPLLIAAYPIIFLYGHNVQDLGLGSLNVPLVYTFLAAGLAYVLFFLLLRKQTAASLSASLFMFFYYSYGFIYRWLLTVDKFTVDHFALLPLVLALAVYSGLLIGRLKPVAAAPIQNVALIISAVLVGYNLAIILPAEIHKDAVVKAAQKDSAPAASVAAASAPSASAAAVALGGKRRADIYYIIFDEYVGFDAMRAYWDNLDVNTFENFLNQNHFFVADQSKTVTINTQTEMASRLNLHQYAENADPAVTKPVMDNNKVMAILKSYGYNTAVLNMAFQGFKADYILPYDPKQVSGMAADEFKQTFFNDTMFNAFIGFFEANDPSEIRQRDLIFYTLNKTVNLPEVASPKFVYTHLLLPHEPFIFDENGNLLPPAAGDDWNYYLGQYIYATHLAENLVTQLLANADPANPPVIILQSDEGARNLQRRSADNIVMNGYLENYPYQYEYTILNALYLPGYDTSTLKRNFPPIDTFQLVLNAYLNAGVKVDTDK